MYYVTMTDKFLSGWGPAKNLKNRLIFLCDTREEAMAVFRTAESRSDMQRIYLSANRPAYLSDNSEKYDEHGGYVHGDFYVQVKTKNDYPSWYGLN